MLSKEVFENDILKTKTLFEKVLTDSRSFGENLTNNLRLQKKSVESA